jgi:hypothetical protein
MVESLLAPEVVGSLMRDGVSRGLSVGIEKTGSPPGRAASISKPRHMLLIAEVANPAWVSSFLEAGADR